MSNKNKEIQNTQKIQNDHADEQLEVEGSEVSSNEDSQHMMNSQEKKAPQQNKPNNKNDTLENMKAANLKGAYKPADYANLPVSNQVKQLFKYIQRYTPTTIELDTKLKAFIPDYIPTVGQVDAFIKMPRPDNQPETLGLNILDEPSLNQSDKAKIDLMMLNTMKQYRGGKYNKVHSIQNADKNPKQILAWINSVTDIHKNKQPPSVSYSRLMPDIDFLMQVWPAEVEDVLNDIKIPSEDIDLSLAQYCKLACNILDIPVNVANSEKNIIESLHVLFTLYSAFKENQHFQNNENESYMYGK